jgi:serine O-acetyltransferase
MKFGQVWHADVMRAYAYMEGSRLKRIINTMRSPGVQVTTVFRFGRWSKLQNKLIRIVTEPLFFFARGLVTIMWGIELHRETDIGAGFHITHFGGIVISPAAQIGKNFTISQGVTIGVSGQGEKRGVPIIGDNVYIATGAKVFGKISIGNNVKIGPNAVVHKSIPDNAIVVAYPGFKILSYQEVAIDPDATDAPETDFFNEIEPA